MAVPCNLVLVGILCNLVLAAVCTSDVNVGYIIQDSHRSVSESHLIGDALRNVSVGREGRVVPLLREVPRRDPLAAAAAACSLADEGVAAILDGGSSSGQCQIHGVPCLSVRTPAGKPGPELEALTVRMEPERSLMSQGNVDLLRQMKWFSFSLVYDSVDHLSLLEPVLSDPSFRVHFVRLEPKTSYEEVVQKLHKVQGSRVVLAVDSSNLRGLLSTFSSVTQKHIQFLVVTANTRLDDLKEASSKHSIMAIRLGSPSQNHKSDANFTNFEEALLLDAVTTLEKALGRWPREGNHPLRTQTGLCRTRQKWDQGRDFFQSLTEVKFSGLSGPVAFSAEGDRSDFSLTLAAFSGGAATEVLSWSPSMDLDTQPPSRRGRRDISLLTGGRKPTLRVAAVLSAPYVMHKEQEGNETEELFGNDRYEGFSIDLMDEIAEEVGFYYILDVGSLYGSQDAQTGEFSGVIGDLVDQRVDAAIGDITVNEARASVIDFTDPWYSFGIGLLVQEIEYVVPLFRFLEVFTPELWWLLIAAALGTAALLFFLSRVSPYERVGAVGQDTQTWTPFTCCYATWFAFGTFFRQFIYFQPRAPSTRVLTLAWWLVVIVAAAYYVANLASILTLRNLRSFNTVKSIYDLPDQSLVTYSSLYGGSTWAFFRDSESESLQRVYSVMYNSASERRILSSTQGIDEVLESDGFFGFLMEEPSLEYAAERNCDLKQLGGTVGSRDYAIALQKDSPYLDYFNDALYSIRESGQLQALRDIWWRERRGGGQCGSRFLAADSSGDSAQVEAKEFAGPVLFLIVGAALAIVLALLECCFFAASSASSKESDLTTEMGQQVSQAFTTSPSSHLPPPRQVKV